MLQPSNGGRAGGGLCRPGLIIEVGHEWRREGLVTRVKQLALVNLEAEGESEISGIIKKL